MHKYTKIMITTILSTLPFGMHSLQAQISPTPTSPTPTPTSSLRHTLEFTCDLGVALNSLSREPYFQPDPKSRTCRVLVTAKDIRSSAIRMITMSCPLGKQQMRCQQTVDLPDYFTFSQAAKPESMIQKTEEWAGCAGEATINVDKASTSRTRITIRHMHVCKVSPTASLVGEGS